MDAAYDVVIIGAGPGGYVAAIRAAQRGAKVALVEKEGIGGTCLNYGCIPTKALVRDAELYRDATSGTYCVDAEGPFRLDFTRLMERKREVVETLVSGVERLLDSYGVQIFLGHGRIRHPGLVEVAGQEGIELLSCHNIIIATGATPSGLSIPGTDLPGVVSSRELLRIDNLPERLVILGGGSVGVEFACIFQALGTDVSLLELKSLVQDTEPQIGRRLRAYMIRQGMSIAIGANSKKISANDDGSLRVEYERKGKKACAVGDLVLLATGRRPNTERLGLEALGVDMNGPAIRVDEWLQTNVPGVYAIGDCTGGRMFAHVASYEAEVAVENILGEKRRVDYRVVPTCIFTMPEIADVGMTEAAAKEAGLAYTVARFPFSANGRALAMGETYGQVRMLCERTPEGQGGKVLGVHIIGPRAGDLIAEAGLAMRLGATAEDIAHTIHAHPTVPEAMMEAAMAHSLGAIHYERR
ncbi:MAG: dihydrolipoyl dehydrogenase [Chloroflexota bacterium]|nr:dihydrolipoyl dehydrogenase [Chloroflexota bacterium]